MTSNFAAVVPENDFARPVVQPRCPSNGAKPSKTKRRIGWALGGLVGLFLIFVSGAPKFTDWPGKTEMLNHLGVTAGLLPKIGILEILVGILFVIPRTSFLGAILVTGYLGGAVMTHVRIGDPTFNTIFPALVGVMMWVGLALRRPVIFSLAFGK